MSNCGVTSLYIKTEQLDKIDYNNVCRSCLTNTNLEPLFENVSHLQQFPLQTIIMECASVQLAENDDLPQKICTQCINLFNQYYAFKKQCENNDKLLHAHKENIKDEDTDCSNIETNFYDEEICDTRSIQCENNDKVLRPHKNNIKDEDTNYSNIKTNMYDEEICDRSIEEYKTNGKFKCDKCSIMFPSRLECDLHIKQTNHRKYIRLRCQLCDKYILSRHMSTHRRTHMTDKQKRKYPCTLCNAKFTMKGNLQRHVLQHTGERKYKCSKCDKAFTQKTTLNDHLIVHSDSKPFICYCGQTYKRRISLKNHLKLHTGYKAENTDIKKQGQHKKPIESDSKYSCGVCFKEFRNKYVFKTHTQTHVKQYLCSDCGKCFSTKCILDKHLLVHTGLKSFKCDFCDKTFAYQGSLKNHLYTHSGERNYKCEVCSKTFIQSSHLNTHKKLHVGLKPHICSICSKEFALKGNLTAHIRIHAGEKSVVCEVCDKRFYDATNLRKHQKRVHTMIANATRPSCEIFE